MSEAAALPAVEDIRRAEERLRDLIVRTPLIESPALNEKFNARILFKPEVLQRTGSFKFRGAYNKIASLPQEQRARGVVAFSSGNHAQGVAASAAIFGIPAVIVMPSDAPAIKLDNVRKAGAEVVLYDRYGESREELAAPYVERGMVLVPPFDDPMIVAGQGTAGLELVEDAEGLGVSLDMLVSPCGGGGLIGGISTAVKALSPTTEIWAAEPENFDDTRRSLAAGRRLSVEPGHRSICDALLSPEPGELTFAINRKNLAGAVAVTDREAAGAMRAAAAYLKLVVEPGGAVAFAAILSGKLDISGKTVAVVLSGGNVDPEKYAELIGSA
jgi:threonine dehydratase